MAVARSEPKANAIDGRASMHVGHT
jgi:hypothetical protein